MSGSMEAWDSPIELKRLEGRLTDNWLIYYAYLLVRLYFRSISELGIYGVFKVPDAVIWVKMMGWNVGTFVFRMMERDARKGFFYYKRWFRDSYNLIRRMFGLEMVNSGIMTLKVLVQIKLRRIYLLEGYFSLGDCKSLVHLGMAASLLEDRYKYDGSVRLGMHDTPYLNQLIAQFAFPASWDLIQEVLFDLSEPQDIMSWVRRAKLSGMNRTPFGYFQETYHREGVKALRCFLSLKGEMGKILSSACDRFEDVLNGDIHSIMLFNHL